MAASRYSRTVRLDDVNNCHSLAVLSIPPGSRVLDIGAADGSVAKVLRDRGCRVWGVEIDPKAAAVASTVCEQVVVGDVETLDLPSALQQVDFDFVLLLDVLEHLVDPIGTLRKVTPLLGPSGRVLASIPNVAHASVKLQLLQGRWKYTDIGLLDRSHLHFFDKPSVEDLFASADLTIMEMLRVVRTVEQTEIDVDAADFPSEVIAAATADPEATTYQFVVIAAPNPDGNIGNALYGADAALLADGGTGRSNGAARSAQASLSEVLQTRVRELEGIVREGEEYVKSLLGEIENLHRVQKDAEGYIESLVAQINEKNKHVDYARELEAVLRDRMAEVETLHEEVKYLRMDLGVRDAYIADLRTQLQDRLHIDRLSPEIRAELDRLRELEMRVANSAGYRFVDRMYNRFRRVPLIFPLTRWFVRRLSGRRRVAG